MLGSGVGRLISSEEAVDHRLDSTFLLAHLKPDYGDWVL
jgi:hypothetical protein